MEIELLGSELPGVCVIRSEESTSTKIFARFVHKTLSLLVSQGKFLNPRTLYH